jgi:hypothetical protein
MKKSHLDEIKALLAPPIAIVKVLSVVVILNTDTIKESGGKIITKAVKDQVGKTEVDYFSTAKQYLLNDTGKLIKLLQTYKDYPFNPKLFKAVEKFFDDPDFTEAKAAAGSEACGNPKFILLLF